jgi:hypothetical protein
MRAARLQHALERLTAAIRDVETELAAMKTEHDPLASHIFISRRHYRHVNDMKSGKRREMNARLSFMWTRSLAKAVRISIPHSELTRITCGCR